MSIEITMPRLSDTMEQGTLIKWNVSEGDEVSAGDVIADIETDKATMEMQVYDDGTLAKLLIDEGQTVDVGATIALLAEDDEDVEDVAQQTGEKTAEADKPDKADKSEKNQEKKKAKEAASEDGSQPEEAEQREKTPKEQKRDKRPAAEQQEAEEEKEKRDTGEPSRAATAQKQREAPREQGEPQRGNGEAGKGDGRMRVSPVARRLAEEHNINLSALQGSGPSGRIIKRDVEHAIEAGVETEAAAAPAGGELAPSEKRSVEPTRVPMEAPQPSGFGMQEQTIELSNMRRTIARRLVESKQTIPHYQVTAVFNMDPLLDQRRDLNEQLADQGFKLSVNDFLVRACALAMYEHPQFNASWQDEQIQVHGRVNVGIAVSLPEERGGGLVVATIYDADRKTLREISWESKQLAEKARNRGLTQDEMAESTFTLSNLGMFGVEHFTAIINPPNSAILAVGAAMQKPVVRNGELTVGHEMSATLSCDHRVIDGAMAARFLQTMREMIENPATLLV